MEINVPIKKNGENGKKNPNSIETLLNQILWPPYLQAGMQTPLFFVRSLKRGKCFF